MLLDVCTTYAIKHSDAVNSLNQGTLFRWLSPSFQNPFLKNLSNAITKVLQPNHKKDKGRFLTEMGRLSAYLLQQIQ